MRKYSFWAVAVLISLFIYSCAPADPQGEVAEASLEEETTVATPAVDSATTAAVVNHHLQAFGANDVDAILTDYADDAVMLMPDGIYRGHAELRTLFEGLVAAFPTGQSTVNVSVMVVEDGYAYLVWNGGSPTLDVPIGTDTFVVKDGKIRFQTFAGILNPVAAAAEEGA